MEAAESALIVTRRVISPGLVRAVWPRTRRQRSPPVVRAEGGSAAPDRAALESQVEEKRGECVRDSEVSGGSEIVEMVVEINDESGEARGKVDLTGLVVDRRNKRKNAMKDKGGKTETDSDCGIEVDWEKEWEGQVLLSHNTTLSGGVGLLFSRGFTPSSLEVEVKVACGEGPVSDDRNHAEPHPASQHCLRQLAYSHGLVDVWRRMYADSRQYTWSRLSEGQELVETGQIRKRAVEFFSSLYESEYRRDEGLFCLCPAGERWILSKTLASRLREAMEQIIHQDQTYCVPGRFIVDNVHLIRDVLEVSRSLDVDTGLISLDQEKAFDWVEHTFLWKVMERFGFSPGFIAMIRILYCDIASMLKFNGSLGA
ncbi:Transposon TX1 uncharacterized 149 kDa protein ORF 2 [Takifugu flavidus]|uniref:Transposon TX1 uncharacterized 149 kDa protein ORF 2 n=1 Tax=Takifugu flavidus TaxID=433684 RepID=A0A5C6MH35_9TELE|nr:Transposon TX1 uncharacterized 149 kDa protein ORF 2 [Takifugu flavidus]